MTPSFDRPAPRPRSAHAPLTPVFIGLRIGLHGLFTALVVFVILRAMTIGNSSSTPTIALAVVLLATYISGAFLTRANTSRSIQLAWLIVVTVEGLVLVMLTPDAAFLVFPLFFLQLHLLRSRWGAAAILVSTVVTVSGVATHNGWTPGVVLGPFIGAGVTIVIGLGYRALYHESEERQQLIDQLLATRQELASQEREAGVLAERSRLAREIHDTVAQGLSSIQLLLHAAERDGASLKALEHVRLARVTAATNLAETRRFINELTPPALQDQALPGALERLAKAQSRRELSVTFHLSGEPTAMPMRMETALLRIAQGSLANVNQHANAHRAEITLTYLNDWVGLDIVDDGVGFDMRHPADKQETAAAPASFGLIAMRQRVDQLGGVLTVESRPGAGTAIAVAFDLGGVDP